MIVLSKREIATKFKTTNNINRKNVKTYIRSHFARAGTYGQFSLSNQRYIIQNEMPLDSHTYIITSFITALIFPFYLQTSLYFHAFICLFFLISNCSARLHSAYLFLYLLIILCVKICFIIIILYTTE